VKEITSVRNKDYQPVNARWFETTTFDANQSQLGISRNAVEL